MRLYAGVMLELLLSDMKWPGGKPPGHVAIRMSDRIMAADGIWKDRITIDSAVLAGKPTIRGLRISVEQILRSSYGISSEELLEDYPDLQSEDLQACLATPRRQSLRNASISRSESEGAFDEYADQLVGRFAVFQDGRLRIR